MFVDSLHSLHMNSTKMSDCFLGFSAPEVWTQNAFLTFQRFEKEKDKAKRMFLMLIFLPLYRRSIVTVGLQNS